MATNVEGAADAERLWRAHCSELLGFATLLVGPHDAQDVVTDAFMRVVRRGFASIENPRAFLFRAVANTSTDWKRSAARRRQRDHRGGAQHAPVAPPPLPDTELHRAIANLSVQQRAVVYFTYWEDLDSEMIGEHLGIAPATVRRHLARARTHLRKALS